MDVGIAPVPARHLPKYVIVSPVRDEEEYIEKTLRSVTAQTVLPAQWVIVDDGSRDNTGGIIDAYAREYPWITALHRSDRGKRVPGTGVIETFYDGYKALTSADWQFIVKLDGDVGLNPDYFEQCFQRFQIDPALGMCGGMMFRLNNGEEELEPHPLMHVRGPIKLYRRECWDAIGGLIKSPGWDTVDELQANRLGWRTRSFPELKVIHYRPTGAAQGAWKDSMKNGRADFVSGYHPLFMAAKCVQRLFQRPYLVRGLGQACGYASGYLKRMPRVQDPDLITYVRQQQMRRLLGKSSIWK
jgi:biofilm PGA synthesis N-glycosyltransferase PgaC